MVKFVELNSDGFPTSFYSPDIHGDDIPSGAIKVTEEDWLEFINNAGRRRWDGEKVVEYNPPEPTQEEKRAWMMPISKRQLRLALSRNGINLSDLDNTIAAMGEEAVIEWQSSTEYRRLHPLLNQVAGLLSLTQEQVDAMWEQATTI